jgi:hypothetical protein
VSLVDRGSFVRYVQQRFLTDNCTHTIAFEWNALRVPAHDPHTLRKSHAIREVARSGGTPRIQFDTYDIDTIVSSEIARGTAQSRAQIHHIETWARAYTLSKSIDRLQPAVVILVVRVEILWLAARRCFRDAAARSRESDRER